MRIVSFGQVVDLERGGRFTHQFTIELDGQKIPITTDEHTLEQLLQLAAGLAQPRFPHGAETKHFEPNQEQFRQEPPPPSEQDEELAAIFGGEETEQPEGVMGVVAEEPAPQPQSPGGLGTGRPVNIPSPPPRPRVDKDGFVLPVTARTVEMDEMGYPVVAQNQPTIPDDDGADDGTQI